MNAMQMKANTTGVIQYAATRNTFDVIILSSMVVGEIIKLSGQDGVIDVRVLRIFRFLRALRVLRAAKMLPQLALVMETLLRSASAVGYIAGFMLLIAYIFAVIGVTIFKHNDPFHFGTLDRALVSLFRVVTLEDWVRRRIPLYADTPPCHAHTVWVYIHNGASYREGCVGTTGNACGRRT